ncbi:Sugar phosphate isomerase/epimerase [Paenibacillus algorifonticola]|uniref:Sugar phosphate isomerase/epimerase n=1 Tax=Paenibacillus algorifonticola TaxID=684063 RepID=A0A1I2HVR5_9BACL|nr:sugar phosphate isomerase/epimerase [Paenibacillus algorifonticola]SFF33503.1 Sugar phosphate isomerase/epimerase [Paenibacillus algorifonticola]
MKFIRCGDKLRELTATPPGLQLYTLRNELEKDFFGTLEKIAAIGYKLVEPFSWGYADIPAERMKAELNRLGLKSVSTYVYPLTLENLQSQLDYAQTIGAHYIVTSLLKESYADERTLKASIALLRKLGLEIQRRGMQLLYHPHAEEFEIRDGKRTIDRLLAGVGTDVMKLALDMYWVKKAGMDPYSTLLAYKSLSPLIHVKDMDESGNFTEVGQGTIDWAPIFSSFNEAGVMYYFVEQDESLNPLQSIQTSLDYLKSRLVG